jgi:heme/copper-type cytochrome/quinol oxidase subunit 2
MAPTISGTRTAITMAATDVVQGFYVPLLSINAIDGSIIDMREGY